MVTEAMSQVSENMTARTRELQSFLDLTRQAIQARAVPGSPAARATARIFDALAEPVAQTYPAGGVARLPVCESIEPALANARRQTPSLAQLGDALAAIEPKLGWRRRPGAEALGPAFAEGHANAYVVGPDGIERRDDVLVGISLMAPRLQYPDHNHPPEEVYVTLSAGSWRQGAGAWSEPGPGGIVYNPPDVVHAMLSGEQPLLAIWCLWCGRG